jgi:hypothetical protein
MDTFMDIFIVVPSSAAVPASAASCSSCIAFWTLQQHPQTRNLFNPLSP